VRRGAVGVRPQADPLPAWTGTLYSSDILPTAADTARLVIGEVFVDPAGAMGTPDPALLPLDVQVVTTIDGATSPYDPGAGFVPVPAGRGYTVLAVEPDAMDPDMVRVHLAQIGG
jgi:hypothetical protein